MNKEREKDENKSLAGLPGEGMSQLNRKCDLGTIRLNKFEIGKKPEISLFSTISVYGKRKTGKSVFVKWCLQPFRRYLPWGWVFTLTKFNSHYASFVPRSYILEDFSPVALGKIMARQTMARGLWEKQGCDTNLRKFNPCAFVVWDDYMGYDITYDELLRRYYATGRHFMTINFFCAQWIKMTPPTIRSNTDMAVLFNTDYSDSLREYHNDFAGKLSKDEFYRIFHEATRQKHHFLAINNDPNVDIQDKFFTGCAEPLDAKVEYIMGCPEYWARPQDKKQMELIKDGTLQKRIDAASEIASKPAEDIKGHPFPVPEKRLTALLMKNKNEEPEGPSVDEKDD